MYEQETTPLVPDVIEDFFYLFHELMKVNYPPQSGGVIN